MRHAASTAIAVATVPANLALGVDWRLAIPAGAAVLAFGELSPRLLAARPPQPGSRPSGANPLTRREFEVGVLAGQGRSSKEIAAELHRSVHTVDRHLDNTYNKLGISSRVELALWMSKRGLLPDATGRTDSGGIKPGAPAGGPTKPPPQR